MLIRAEARLPKECRGVFRGERGTHPLNLGSVAATQAIAGLPSILKYPLAIATDDSSLQHVMYSGAELPP